MRTNTLDSTRSLRSVAVALTAIGVSLSMVGCAMLEKARVANDARGCQPANTWSQPAWDCGVPETPPAPEPEPEPEPEPVKAKVQPVMRAVLKADKIEILEKVQFETGSADISEESFALLDDVATILIDNPKVAKIRIEGHTDSKGRKRSNKKLSNNRAKAVREYLVDKGVEEERLTAKGYGQSKPIETNKTDEGRAANRRVEFNIVE